MLSCAVYGCTNIQLSIDTDTSIDYHPFPKNDYSEIWIQACGWPNRHIDVATAHVCSVHFEPNAYDTEIKVVDNSICVIKTLKPDAVPTLNLPEPAETNIVIKEDNLQGITLIYTVNENDDDITIDLDEHLKFVTNKVPQIDNSKYEHVKTHFDLHILKAQNKSLNNKIQQLEEEVSAFEEELSKKNIEYQKFEEECRQVKAQLSSVKVKKGTLSNQDQKTILGKVFSDAQIKMLFGKKKVVWSSDDMAVGYTIRHLSNRRFYMYLTKNLNIPLPGLSSIKRWLNLGLNNSKRGKKKKTACIEDSTMTEEVEK